MDDVETKRVFADRTGGAELLVAAADGLLAVEVSADRVGGFGFVHRCAPVDLAASGGLVALATDGDVLVRSPGSDDVTTTGFDRASAVGVADGAVYAAGDDGVARRDAGGTRPDWVTLGELGGAVRAIDPPLLAASDGLHRLPDLEYVGLADAYDVAAAGPLAATADGLYSLGNGWMDEVAGEFRAVATDGDRAHAATPDAFFERRAGEWGEVAVPADGPVVDVAYGDVPYAVTADGVVLAEGEDGWRSTPLGVEGVVGCSLG